MQFPKWPNPKVRLGPLRLEQARGPSAAARTDLESCHLGNCTVGKKYPWKVAAFKKSHWYSTFKKLFLYLIVCFYFI